MKIISILFFLGVSPVLASSVNHQHSGRPHSHALPSEGLQHQHNQGAVGSAITPQPNVPNKAAPVAHHPHGYFSGSPKLEQLPDGRRKRLLETLIFIDPKGKQWTAPQGSIVDGASIPKALWSFIGSPFAGKYLAASIIHDVACVEKKERWQAVHNVFHEAMLASQVHPKKAKRMYGAVYRFGPRWGDDVKSSLAKEPYSELPISYVKKLNDYYFYAGINDKAEGAIGFGREARVDFSESEEAEEAFEIYGELGFGREARVDFSTSKEGVEEFNKRVEKLRSSSEH